MQQSVGRGRWRRSLLQALMAGALLGIPCLAVLGFGPGLLPVLGTDAFTGGVMPLDRPVAPGDLAPATPESLASAVEEGVLGDWLDTASKSKKPKPKSKAAAVAAKEVTADQALITKLLKQIAAAADSPKKLAALEAQLKKGQAAELKALADLKKAGKSSPADAALIKLLTAEIKTLQASTAALQKQLAALAKALQKAQSGGNNSAENALLAQLQKLINSLAKATGSTGKPPTVSGGGGSHGGGGSNGGGGSHGGGGSSTSPSA